MRQALLCLILILVSIDAFAQKRGSRRPAQESGGDAYKFAPPPPPPLDPPEYDELEDEEFDDGFRPPPIPPVPGAANPNMGQPPPPPTPPPPDFRSSNNSYLNAGPGKFRFQVVDGEYYEKGKKRGRGKRLVGQSTGN